MRQAPSTRHLVAGVPSGLRFGRGFPVVLPYQIRGTLPGHADHQRIAIRAEPLDDFLRGNGRALPVHLRSCINSGCRRFYPERLNLRSGTFGHHLDGTETQPELSAAVGQLAAASRVIKVSAR